MAIIAVDVDITVVDTPRYWYEWLCEQTGQRPEIPNPCPYDISTLFNPEPYTNPMDFWKPRDLYDNIEPYWEAVEVLDRLAHQEEHDIIFVSMCKGDHGHSKYDMLKKHFPYMRGALWTREKQYVKCDYIIDDRHSFINKVDWDTKAILIESNYEQDISIRRPCFRAKNWNEIGGYFGV